MSEQEKTLHFKTATILGKDTSRMTLNDIIEGLVNVIETYKMISADNELVEEGNFN